jgi:hypothetical protein
MATPKPQSQTQTFKELRASLQEVDTLRLSKELSDYEREALELTAVALRDAERVAIAKTQSQIIKDLEAQAAGLQAQAKVIRARVTRMNKTSKVLDKVESVIKTAVRVVAVVAKW